MPIPPAVALDLPAELRPELASAAMRTCNLALGDGRCVGASEGRTDRPVAWVAHLERRGAGDSTVQVTLSAAGSTRETVGVRLLEFQPSDGILQRWETAGVVVAALVVGVESGEELGSASMRDEGVLKDIEPMLARDAPRARPSESDVRIDLSALLGPGLDTGPFRLGGQLRGGVGFGGTPLFGWASVEYARSDGDVSLAWWSGGAGLGLRVPTWFSLVSVDARLGAIATYVDISATERSITDSASRWRGGGTGAADLVLGIARDWCGVLSWETTAAWPLVEITRRDEPVGIVPPVRWNVLLGLRWVALGGNRGTGGARWRRGTLHGALR